MLLDSVEPSTDCSPNSAHDRKTHTAGCKVESVVVVEWGGWVSESLVEWGGLGLGVSESQVMSCGASMFTRHNSSTQYIC